MSHWQPYLIAIVVGLLIGIEREKAHPNQKAMGVRTFLLVSLLGAIAGGITNQWIGLLLAAFSLGLILISYFNQTNSRANDVDRGLTTEFAAGIIFCLGYAAHQSPALTALIGPLVGVVLFSKSSLHRFTHAIKPSEFQAALLLLLAGVVVVNLLPDRFVDKWGIINPQKFGYLVLILAILEFSSYVLAKFIGEKKGSLIVGFLGGLVSSTAVLVSSTKQAKKSPEAWRTLASSALIAKLAALAELLLIVGLISPLLLAQVAIPIGSGIFFGAIVIVFISRTKEKRSSELKLKSPLDWWGVIRLALLLAAILALISLAKLWLGESATLAISFITGLFELHGVSLANATMQTQDLLSLDVATTNIMMATCASLVAKISIAWIIDRGTYTKVLSAVFFVMLVIISAVAWLLYFNNQI